MTWVDIGPLASVPERGARVVRLGSIDVAVFRTGSGTVYALRDRCPHRGGPLSQGIVHAECVTCPLHDWVIDLASGTATGADSGATGTFAVRIAQGRIWLETEAGEASSEHAFTAAPPPESARSGPASCDAFDARAYALFERG